MIVRNKKGFTLMELLAVIVILAVLVLVALPAVSNLMARARKGAFRTEALDMARNGVQLAYSANMLSGVAENAPTAAVTADTTYKSDGSVNTKGKNNIVYHLSGGEYLCMTVKDLIDKGYIEKANYNTYGGFIQIFVASDGTTTMAIDITNGTYYLKTTYNKLAKVNDVDGMASAVLDSTNNVTAGNFSCPSIPANAGSNVMVEND